MTLADIKDAVSRLAPAEFDDFQDWFLTLDADRTSSEGIVPDDVLRRAVQEALDDPRPSIPIEEAFERLERHHRDVLRRRA